VRDDTSAGERADTKLIYRQDDQVVGRGRCADAKFEVQERSGQLDPMRI
jgi:hypothetical protein